MSFGNWGSAGGGAINSASSFIEYTVPLSPLASSTDANTYSVMTLQSQAITFICNVQDSCHLQLSRMCSLFGFFCQESLVRKTDLVAFTLYSQNYVDTWPVAPVCSCGTSDSRFKCEGLVWKAKHDGGNTSEWSCSYDYIYANLSKGVSLAFIQIYAKFLKEWEENVHV